MFLPIFFMNIHIKFFNKILIKTSNRKRVNTSWLSGFYFRKEVGLPFRNQLVEVFILLD